MNQNMCYNCGGEFVERGRKYICPYCGTVKPQDVSNEEISLLYTAYQKLRLADFYEAEQEFDDIIRRYPENAQGYWGRLLARYGIKYEDDYDGTKIPSCYLASIDSIFEASDYKKALKYADSDNRSVYKKHADYIEHVRKEWIERASKEAPYDIFISYKDSDRENGIERTDDSYAMQEMYFRLKEKGYRVFFSRESLRGVSGKEYEPYIFNALSTAKVMIVYASKPEYINATWVKNEWTRYLGRIRSGDKKQGSLLVVYEGFIPKELPTVLARLQCLNAADKFFYPDLLSSIEQILAEYTDQNSLDLTELNVNKQEESQGLAYKANNDGKTCEITGLGSCEDETIVIPKKIDRYTVVGIAEKAFYENSAIASVTIPNTVRSIGESAFSKCTGLSNVIIPKSVTSIGGWAFYHCSGIASITIPSSVKNIGNRAFWSVGEINVATGNFHYISIDGNLYSRDKKTFIHYAVSKMASEFEIPSTVVAIADAAFAECSNLESITIPSSVKSIGDYAFHECKSLTNITIPFSVKTIGECAFIDCVNLESIEIPSSVMSLGESVFRDCSSLMSATLPSSIKSIEECTFYGCKKLASLTLPKFLTSIGKWAFYHCESLSSLTLPSTVKDIDIRAFVGVGETNVIGNNPHFISEEGNLYSKDMKTLIHYAANKTESEFAVPSPVEVIADSALSGCNKLTSVLLPNTVKEISDFAFFEATGLETINIPLSVKKIGESAFSYCKKLTDFRYAGTPEQWGLINLNESWKNNSGIDEIQYDEADADEFSQKASEGLAYKILDGKTCEITGLGSCEDENIVVPRKMGNYTVTGIGEEAFRECAGIVSVTLPNTIKSIGESAFHACFNLVNVTIPKSVTSIGGWAFFDCKGIESLELPLSVKEIGKRAFSRIGATYISNSNPYYTSVDGNLYSKDMKTLIHYAANKLENSFEIPSSVTAVADSAFSECVNLVSVEIPSLVKDIGDFAFFKCEALENVSIPDGVTSIGDSVFRETAIENVKIPQGVVSIGESAFSDCTKLTSVTIPDSVTSIGGHAFRETALETVIIPQGVTSIGESAFDNCTKLTSVTIPDSVTSIGGWAFYHCGSLLNLTIPNTVKDIDIRAFVCVGEINVSGNSPYYISVDGNLYSKDMKTLIHYAANKTESEFAIPSSVEVIADSALSECHNLKSVVLPDTVTEISDFAFFEASVLESINIPLSVKTIGESAFSRCKKLTNFRYAGAQEQWNQISFHENWNNKAGIKEIQYNELGIDGVAQKVSEGLAYKILDGKACEITGLGSCEDENIVIPGKMGNYTVTGIGKEAFRECAGIVSVTLPNTIKSIGESAFHKCFNLVNVTIPKSVTSIEGWAFFECKGIESLELPLSVKKIGKRAFKGVGAIHVSNSNPYYISVDGNLYSKDMKTLIHYAANKLENSFEIPSSVTAVADSAFSECVNLVSVEIPSLVKDIGDFAFFKCEALENVSIPDGVTSIGDSVFRETAIENVKIPQGVVSIGESAFSDCTKLTSVTIPDSVTSIGGHAFRETALETVIIPHGVTNIENSAFSGCKKLSSITIPDSVTSIGGHAFKETALETVIIPQGVMNIENSTFSGCTKLMSVTIPDSVTSIGGHAFRETAIENVKIPQGVTNIGNSAFNNCTKLTSVTIPDSVVNIGGWAFYHCENLLSLALPSSVKDIDIRAFVGVGEINVSGSSSYYISVDGNLYSKDMKTLIHYAANKMESEFAIPSSVEVIADSALSECRNLTSVLLPDTVTEISDFAFSDSSILESINIPLSVKTIGKSAFESCTNLKDFRYAGTQEQWNQISLHETWRDKSGIQEIRYNEVDVANSLSMQASAQVSEQVLQSQEFVYTIHDDQTCEITELDSCNTENLVIPQKIGGYTVTGIGEMAFFNCTHLVSVSIPDSVKKIGAQAFYNCTRLKTVNIPSAVTNIDFQTFYNCISLKNVDSPAIVTDIGMQAFYNCINLIDVNISNSLRNVGAQAFYNCISLKKKGVPNAAANIGLQAFHD